jgi:predicted transcriptional regulator
MCNAVSIFSKIRATEANYQKGASVYKYKIKYFRENKFPNKFIYQITTTGRILMKFYIRSPYIN